MPRGTYPNTAPTRGTYNWLRLRVGLYLRAELGSPDLGTDVNYDNWDSYQNGVVDEMVQSGLFQFYYPPTTGQKVPYEWSFLKPEGTIATLNADFDYDLPADFGGIVQDFTYTTADATRKPKLVSPEELMAQRGAVAAATGPPKYIAIRPKTSTGSAAQAFEAIVYPTPVTGTLPTLRYRYLVVPPLMTASATYPLGALSHAETIAASCLATAEVYWKGQMGPMRQYFMERLRASISIDMRGNALSTGEVTDMLDLRQSGVSTGGQS